MEGFRKVLTGMLGACCLALIVTTAGCEHGDLDTHGRIGIEILGHDGYHHRGYYDDDHRWHGGYYDRDDHYHADPDDWRR